MFIWRLLTLSATYHLRSLRKTMLWPLLGKSTGQLRFPNWLPSSHHTSLNIKTWFNSGSSDMKRLEGLDIYPEKNYFQALLYQPQACPEFNFWRQTITPWSFVLLELEQFPGRAWKALLRKLIYFWDCIKTYSTVWYSFWNEFRLCQAWLLIW